MQELSRRDRDGLETGRCRDRQEEELRLHPFPEGWYFVTDRRSLLKRKLIEKQWMGEDIVAWCDDRGTVCVARSVCPHLGSSLGPAAGGCVRNGRLVCPFHGFAYDAAGACVATPFAEPPGNTRLTVFETREIMGLVFAWWGLGGRPPRWSLPDPEPGEGGWSPLILQTLRFPAHPQETAENAVDLAHLRYVHGYDNVAAAGKTAVDGAVLTTSFAFRTGLRMAGLTWATYDVSAMTRIHGLGYSLVDIREQTIGVESRLWILATPVDGTLMDMTLAGQVREIRRPRRPIAGLSFLPVRMRTALMSRLWSMQQRRDVLQDVEIWRRKKWRVRPRLSRADGPIGQYRHYCRQFYPSGRPGISAGEDVHVRVDRSAPS